MGALFVTDYLLEQNMERILAIDVGAGTQDILLYDPAQPMENNVKLVLPSWTTLLARRIKQATVEGRPIFLTGSIMGGGPCVSAMKRHIKAGHPIFATPQAARTIRDNLDEVRARGYEIVDAPPALPNLLTLETRDVDLDSLARALAPFDVVLPERYVIAVQDHGDDTGESQRKSRFRLWEHFLAAENGDIARLIYAEPPGNLTRMRAVQETLPGALLMDTGAAAIWGILQDQVAAAHREEGFIAVNVGNQHVLGMLVQGERILGLFEYHTVLCDPEKLAALVQGLRAGTLDNDEVRTSGGHGAAYHPDYRPGAGFRFVSVTGPQRAMAQGLGYTFAAPYGDMMLTGCFGLVAAAQRLLEARA